MSHHQSHGSRYCQKCGKANKACICEHILALKAKTELIILQHDSEQNHPLGSARILSLSLENARLFIGEDFSEHHELNQLLAQSDYQHYILYPGEQSIALTTLTTSAVDNKVRLILLDGTWKKAYKMWQLSANLQALPCVSLPSDIRGDYQIRKAPSDNALSTVEAGYHALSILQPESDFSPLLDAFRSMIQFQIDQMPPGVFERNYLRSDV
ncbi:tRNA-uridine aminocarboxypropyltransferase [Vibrio sp. WXL103]|uniref:tRNA-uridine aminocarboxypropyltransferase n=1 Tax=Vibrio sp. WXL103 TaxID=3450710 RepID=UPI003EC6748D